jgi:hypothetical protein
VPFIDPETSLIFSSSKECFAMKTILPIVLFVTLAAGVTGAEAPQENGPVHRAAPLGSSGGIMNPDISVVVNTMALFTDDKENDARYRLSIKEAEIAFQSYLYPGIRGDFIVAMHEESGEWHTHPEEAVVSFLDLPLGIQAQAGRRLIPFGRLNAVHPHHWVFYSEPLVLLNFFGEHPWFDDGIQLDWLVPNPWDIYCKLAAGAWSGQSMEHHHSDSGETAGEEDAHAESTSIEWHGKAFNARANIDLPFGELSNAVAGYSVAWDEGAHTVLHGADFTLTYRHPLSYTRIRWQSEVFMARTKDGNGNHVGCYSFVAITPNKYWELGARGDWSEFLPEHHEADNGDDNAAALNDHEWGVSAFLTYYFTHSLYLRSEYRHILDRFDAAENQAIVQLVWGLGPHAHRLDD